MLPSNQLSNKTIIIDDRIVTYADKPIDVGRQYTIICAAQCATIGLRWCLIAERTEAVLSFSLAPQ
jgi:hypothetical protein